jgi:hypothetical protein
MPTPAAYSLPEGKMVRHLSYAPVYIVIDGILRWLPGKFNFNIFNGGWDVPVESMDLSLMPGFDVLNPDTGAYPLPHQTLLIKGRGEDPVYLIDFKDIPRGDETLVKRWIRSMSTYNFDSGLINDEIPFVISAIPNGNDLPCEPWGTPE